MPRHPAAGTTAAAAGRERLYGIDAGRIVCAFLVILLHLTQYTRAGGAENAPVQIVCRVAVPFFFIASGYFLKLPDRLSAAAVLQPLRRIAPIYVFWSLAYLVAFAVFLHAPTQATWYNLISGGRAFQLWFLPALALAMIVVIAGWTGVGARATGLACIVAAVAGVVVMTYLPGIAVVTKLFVRLLCAPLFVYLGVWLARRPRLPTLRVAVAIMAAGLLSVFAEELTLSRLGGQALASHDFTFSCYAYGAGAFLACRQLASSPTVAWLGRRGRLALGVYIVQLFPIIVVARIVAIHSFGALLAGAAIVFALSYAAAHGIARYPRMRHLIL